MTVGSTRRDYANPPITEALCQVNFAHPVPWNVASPGILYREIEGDYPEVPEAQQHVQAQIEVPVAEGVEPSFAVNRGGQRFIFKDAEQKQLLIANEGTFSVNSLKPYEGWPNLSKRFAKGLADFSKAVGEFAPAVVSLRYINEIIIPTTHLRTEDYFHIPVIAAASGAATVSAFMMRTESSIQEAGADVAITFASKQHPVDGETGFLLDIEVRKPVPTDSSIKHLLQIAEELHSIENAEFESSITDRTRGLFE